MEIDAGCGQPTGDGGCGGARVDLQVIGQIHAAGNTVGDDRDALQDLLPVQQVHLSGRAGAFELTHDGELVLVPGHAVGARLPRPESGLAGKLQPVRSPFDGVVTCDSGLSGDTGVAEVLHRGADHPVGVVDDGDGQAAPVSVVGVRQTDDAGAHHDDVVLLLDSHANYSGAHHTDLSIQVRLKLDLVYLTITA
jgi:hypothetical protein